MAIFIAICTFLVVVVILGSLYVLQASAAQQLALKRLDSVIKAEKRGSASLDLHLIRDELLSDVPILNKMLLQWDWATRLRQFVAQSGVKIKPGKLLLVGGILAFCADLGVQQFVANPYLTLAAAAAGAVLPFAFVGFKRSRRLRAFEKVFPEAIDLLGRSVRAGHAFTTGLEMIATEMAEPLAGEFRLAFEEQNFGLPLRDALLNLCERVPILDVRFFVTALLVQKETGGNLAEVLDNLSHVIRERFRDHGRSSHQDGPGPADRGHSDRPAAGHVDPNAERQPGVHQAALHRSSGAVHSGDSGGPTGDWIADSLEDCADSDMKTAERSER